MAHWVQEHAQNCLGTSRAQLGTCKSWVEVVHAYLLAKNGVPVPLAELGLRVPPLPKKFKMLSVLQADDRFKWFEAPTHDAEKGMRYLAVAVRGADGQLADHSMSLQQALLLVGKASKPLGARRSTSIQTHTHTRTF